MNTNLYKIFTLKEKNFKLIHDVVARKLTVNSDKRGTLVEILKTSWTDIFDSEILPFTQVYYSKTKSGVARDKSDWHFHPGGQVDRYVVISGEVIFAIYDTREKSKTRNFLNLFWIGESLGKTGQYSLLVPPRTLHCFIVVSKKPATLLNFPSRLYDPREEVRIPFKKFPLPDGTIFSWTKVKKAHKMYAKQQ
jgi:dTDP-4-dehydrorhamnose 3,5-epimerase-like enzyme